MLLSRNVAVAEWPTACASSPHSFASIDALYVEKVRRNRRATEELDQILTGLTGYDKAGLDAAIADGRTLEGFAAQAPAMNPRTDLIRDVVCGVRVEDIDEPLMQQVRWMDKLVDELARGKKLGSILRSPTWPGASAGDAGRVHPSSR